MRLKQKILALFRVRLFNKKNLLRRFALFAGAIAIGAMAISLAMIADYADKIFHHIIRHNHTLPFLITPLGFVLISWLTRKCFLHAEGSGVPQVIASIKLKDHTGPVALLSLPVALGKYLLTIAGFFIGASIGREGPTIQIGAAIMKNTQRIVDFPKHDVERGLVMAGGAAGIAAAFNTPLAGVLFAIEELSRSYEHRISGTLLTGVVLAGLCAQSGLGNYTYFGSSYSSIDLDLGWFLAVFVASVTGGVVGGLFSLALIQWTQRLVRFTGRYPVLIAFVAGLVLAILGWLSHGVIYGSGYSEAKAIMHGHHFVGIDGFVYYKFLASFVSYISGIPGGIFAPSLAVGAGLGHWVSGFLPHVDYRTVVILCMAAYFSGVIQSPITCFVIVNEMVFNHHLVLPIITTTVMANLISRQICTNPLYEVLAMNYVRETKAHAETSTNNAPLGSNQRGQR